MKLEVSWSEGLLFDEQVGPESDSFMFDFLEEILNELKDIPGLNFLRGLHTKLRIKSARIRKQAQHLQNRRNDLVQGTKKIRGITQSSKGNKSRDH